MDKSWKFPPPESAVERERLRELKLICLLDTPREDRFDRLMELAVMVTDTSAAWFCLIDENRQWFKSEKGLDQIETSRDASLCAYTILEEGPMVIEDIAAHGDISREHACMSDDSRIASYCGIPVRGPLRGTAIGTVGVLDDKPRVFTDEQKRALATIRDEVETQIALDMTRTRIGRQKIYLDEIIDESEEMFQRLRSRAIDLAGALQSDAAFIGRRTNNEILSEAAEDIVRGAETMDDMMNMAQGFVMWNTGQLKTLCNELEDLKGQKRSE